MRIFDSWFGIILIGIGELLLGLVVPVLLIARPDLAGTLGVTEATLLTYVGVAVVAYALVMISWAVEGINAAVLQAGHGAKRVGGRHAPIFGTVLAVAALYGVCVVVSRSSGALGLAPTKNLAELVGLVLLGWLIVTLAVRAATAGGRAVRSLPAWAWMGIGVLVLVVLGGKIKLDVGDGGLRRFTPADGIAERALGLADTSKPNDAALADEAKIQTRFFQVPDVRVEWNLASDSLRSSDPVATYSAGPACCPDYVAPKTQLHQGPCPDNPNGTVRLGWGFIDQELRMDGRVAVAAVLAHELGHQVQYRDRIGQRLQGAGYDKLQVDRLMELEADCFAAYCVQHSQLLRWASPQELSGYASCILKVGDDVTYEDPYGRVLLGDLGDHGTPDQRWKAANWGITVAEYERRELKGERLSWDQLHSIFLVAAAKMLQEPFDVQTCLYANVAMEQQVKDLQLVNWDLYARYGV